MAEEDRQNPRTGSRAARYLIVAGALLILMGLAVALADVSSPPGQPAPSWYVTAGGLMLALAFAAAGIATLLRRGYWLAEVATFSLVLLNVGYGWATGTPSLAVGGIITALAILLLVRSGRSLFSPVLPARSSKRSLRAEGHR